MNYLVEVQLSWTARIWLSPAFLNGKHGMKAKMEKRKLKGTCAVLLELGMVDRLYNLLDKFLKSKSFALSKDDIVELNGWTIYNYNHMQNDNVGHAHILTTLTSCSVANIFQVWAQFYAWMCLKSRSTQISLAIQSTLKILELKIEGS